MKFLTILKAGGSILFNTSVIAGIVAVGAMGTARMLPTETKSSVQRAVDNFESPIEEALTDQGECYYGSDFMGPEATFNYLMLKYGNEPELRAVCMSREQKKEEVRINEKFDAVQNARDEAEMQELYECAVKYGDDGTMCREMLGMNNFSIDYNSPKNEDSLNGAISWAEWNNERETKHYKELSDYWYERTGERLPYYDLVNKKVVYGEEQ